MRLDEYKNILVGIALIGILIISSPVIYLLLPIQTNSSLSTIRLLGHEHTPVFLPAEIVVDRNYSIYIDADNFLGTQSYYLIIIKFDNGSYQSTGTTENSSPIYEYRFIINNNETWETNLLFSFSKVDFVGDKSIVEKINIDDEIFNVNKLLIWDTTTSSYKCGLIFELWVFDPKLGFPSFNSELFLPLYLQKYS